MVLYEKEILLIGEREVNAAELLVERIRSGDRGAESEFVETYGRRVYAIALARLHDPEIAEDLTQEALMAGLAALRNGRLESPEKLSPFLRGTVRNLCNSHLRRLPRRPVGMEHDPPSQAPNPEVRFRRRELLSLTSQFASELDVMDQKILLWSLVDGMGSKAIAKQLGMRPEAVRQHKSRALRKVRSKVLSLSQIPSRGHKGNGGS